MLALKYSNGMIEEGLVRELLHSNSSISAGTPLNRPTQRTRKIRIRHGTPFFTVRPDVVFALSNYPTDATR